MTRRDDDYVNSRNERPTLSGLEHITQLRGALIDEATLDEDDSGYPFVMLRLADGRCFYVKEHGQCGDIRYGFDTPGESHD